MAMISSTSALKEQTFLASYVVNLLILDTDTSVSKVSKRVGIETQICWKY